MPKPRKGEKQNKFMSRCISDVMGEGKAQKQAIAICFSMWREKSEYIEIPVREEIAGNHIRAVYVWDGVWAIYDRDQAAFISYFFEDDYGEENAKEWVNTNGKILDEIVELAHKIYKERGDG